MRPVKGHQWGSKAGQRELDCEAGVTTSQPIQWGVTGQRQTPANCTPQTASVLSRREIWAGCIHGCHSSLCVPHGFTFHTSGKWWTSLGATIICSWAEIWKREISRNNYSPITAAPPVIAIGVPGLPFLLSILNPSLPQLSAGLVLEAYLMMYLRASFLKS